MRLIKARVQNYRSIIDTDYFEIEDLKTIFVGPNEAGKSAILQALQKLSSSDTVKFDPLRDYPRAKYNDVTTGKVKIEDIKVVEGHYRLEENDLYEIPERFKNATYVFMRHLDNKTSHRLEGCQDVVRFSDFSNDFRRMVAHIEARTAENSSETNAKLFDQLKNFTKDWQDKAEITKEQAIELRKKN